MKPKPIRFYYKLKLFFFLVKVKSDHIFLVELVCIRSLSENLVL